MSIRNLDEDLYAGYDESALQVSGNEQPLPTLRGSRTKLCKFVLKFWSEIIYLYLSAFLQGPTATTMFLPVGMDAPGEYLPIS